LIDLNNNVRGNKALPQSTIDRFHVIEVPWPEENFLKAVLYSEGCDNEKVAESLWKFAEAMWKAYDDMRISYALSPRRLFQTVRLINRGYDFDQALGKSVLPFLELKTDKPFVKGQIENATTIMQVRE